MHCNLAVFALLGAVSAIKDYYYNDETQYEGNDIKTFIESSKMNFNSASESHNDKAPTTDKNTAASNTTV